MIILKGNLAPEGAVAKVSGVKVRNITGPAKVFDSEEAAIEAVLSDEIVDGDVVVVRFVGPKGGPGMPEMLSLSSMIVGKGQGRQGSPLDRRTLLRWDLRSRCRSHCA